MSSFFRVARRQEEEIDPYQRYSVSTNQQSKWDESVFFPADSEGRYMIIVKIMSADASCMVPVSCMESISMASDPGADMLLVTKDVADTLGHDVDLISENHNFFVQGKSGQPTTFKEIQTWIQLGNMRPLSAPIGLAVDDESLIENLFGNKGTLDSGEIYAIYNQSGVTYRDALHGSGKQEGGTLLSFWR